MIIKVWLKKIVETEDEIPAQQIIYKGKCIDCRERTGVKETWAQIPTSVTLGYNLCQSYRMKGWKNGAKRFNWKIKIRSSAAIKG